jgi:alcohol dehydrogenase class IV
MRFEFATAGRIIFGSGSLGEVVKLACPLGKRSLVVTGSSSSRPKQIGSLLANAGLELHFFSVKGEPTIQAAVDGARLVRETGVDAVIGFGGGSAIDAAKAIAALATNTEDVFHYLEVIGRGQPLTKRPLPCIAVPTTAGTGSEVTRNAVLVSPEHRVKVSLRSPAMLPVAAVVDPDLTLDLPPALTATTGLDALTQVIEPYLCNRANPMSDAVCVDGIRRAARSLPTAFHDGSNRAAREDMALASLFGGLALANAGLGAVHGLAGPIGGMFPAPHGAVCAALLPAVMKANLLALRHRAGQHPVLARFDEVARLLAGPAAVAEDGIQWLVALVKELQIPSLGSYGVTAADLSSLVQQAGKASSMKANPIELTADELAGILESTL